MTTPKGGCLIGGWVFYQSYVEIYLNLLTLNLHFFGNLSRLAFEEGYPVDWKNTARVSNGVWQGISVMTLMTVEPARELADMIDMIRDFSKRPPSLKRASHTIPHTSNIFQDQHVVGGYERDH